MKAKLIILAVAVAGLAAVLAWIILTPPKRLEAHEGLVYLGPATVTAPAPGADDAALERAEAAFRGAGYFAAYAEGPGGRSGLWTGAHRADRARDYALAACGAGCTLVAERRPAAEADRSVRVIPPEMAAGLRGRLWRGDFYARGGANAWGAAVDPPGRGFTGRYKRRALAECNARLAEEATPEGLTPAPCRGHRFVGIHDARPKAELYPAPFEIALTRLVAAEPRLVDRESVGNPFDFLGAVDPKGLHGAAASSPDGARGYSRNAGWPEAGERLALVMCDAERAFADAPCVVTKSMQPAQAVSPETLAVPPNLLASFHEWEALEGAGAFAISPFGAWGSSYGLDDLDSAIQKAADWCLYYGRTSRVEFDFDYHFLEVDIPCRIVALREPARAELR